MRGRHQGNRCECRCRRRREHGKRWWSRDERFAIDDADPSAFLRANLRALPQIDVAAASKNLVEHVRREENVGDGILHADGRFVSDRRMHGESRGRCEQRQPEAVGECEGLEEDIDVAVEIAA